jgi:shikimate dehydrogenase
MTDRYAVIGNPIGHSKSPLIHGSFACQTGQDLVYEAIEARPGGFEAAVDAFRAGGGRGMNVTMPFKLDAFAYATERMERARVAGAANALRFEGARVFAENFDGVGLANDIERNLGRSIAGRRVLLMGAGGAVRGALPILLERHPARLVVANRTVAKATALGELYAAHRALAAGGYPDLGAQTFDIVIDATSASLEGELAPVPPTAFAEGCLAYGLVYGRGLTPFLRLARERGAGHLADGVGMLVEQAAEAFLWWRGVRPDTRPMIAQLTVPLT